MMANILSDHNANFSIKYSCVKSVTPEVEAECRMFAENEIKPSLQVCFICYLLNENLSSMKVYQIIPILRLLEVKRTQPDLYNATVERFESHWEVRRQQAEVASFIKFIGAFIRSKPRFQNIKEEDI